MGTVRPTRAALPQMYRRGGGSIIIVGSIRAYYPRPGLLRLLCHQGGRHQHREGLVKGIGAQEHPRSEVISMALSFLDSRLAAQVSRVLASAQRAFDRLRRISNPKTSNSP